MALQRLRGLVAPSLVAWAQRATSHGPDRVAGVRRSLCGRLGSAQARIAELEARERRIADLDGQLQKQVGFVASVSEPAPGVKIAGVAPSQAGIREIKEIKGIGQVLAGVLNDHGIHTFKRIADLDVAGHRAGSGSAERIPRPHSP